MEYRYTGNEAATKPPVGKAYEEVTRNSAGKIVQVRIFNAQGKPDTSFGIHRYEYTYDSAGNRTSESYFRVKGEPVTVYGAHRLQWTYDSRGT